MRHGAPESIQPPDGQHIAVAQVAQRASQAGAVGLGPRSRILEDTLTARRAQHVRLQGGVQVRGRYACVADQCHDCPPIVRNLVRLSYCP